MGKEMYERLARELEERYPPVTIHCFGCGAVVEAEWEFCKQCGIDLFNLEED
jgi:rRNA maturation endonuclease Nob1